MVPAVLRGNALSTWSATAVPEAAACVVRAAARRRAVRLALVVGAVFALGVLFGEQAEAADGRPAVGGVVRVDAGGARSVLGGLTAAGDGPAARKPAGSEGRLANERESQSAAQPPAESGARHAETRVTHADGELGSRSGRQAVAESGSRSVGALGTVSGGERAASGQGALPRAESGARSAKQPGLPSLGEAVRGADERVGRPVVERVVQSVVRPAAPVETPLERVVRPVGRLVHDVTQELGAVTPTLPAVSLPVLEQPTALPPQVLPGLPTLPTTLPAPAGVPAQLLPAADAPAAPAGHAPAPPPAPADIPAVPAQAAPGPRPSVATPATAPTALTAPRAAHQATPAPPQAPPAPTPTGGGESDGPLGSRSSADPGTARHADAGAVPAAHRAQPRLLPGAAAPAETPRTREHSRDVHVPPA
ncbi:hypothetical protein [Streptomyces sp. enrichment culture]|uniref:hypothetical protein n=1 Tax=Streptomyces sp. enrichment culture TaxID=1795815 RepID=UPI003F557129